MTDTILKKSVRYAHSEGHTDVCFDESGRYMLTAGDDGDVKIWEGIEGDDITSHVGNKAYAVQCCDGRFYSANDINSIQIYTFPDCSPDGILSRFTAPVICMALSADRKNIAACSSDFTIKVIDIEESLSKSYLGHSAPALCASIDPLNEFLASSSCDGSVKVWSLEDQKCITTLNILPKSNDFAHTQTLCRLVWESEAPNNLLVPVSTTIEVYGREKFEKLEIVTDEHIKQDVWILCVSSCGRYLAASCRDGAIVVWNWLCRTVAVRTGHDKLLPITAMCWNPDSSICQIAFCDMQGQLGVIDNVIPEYSTKKTDKVKVNVEDKMSDVVADDASVDDADLDRMSDLESDIAPVQVKNPSREDGSDNVSVASNLSKPQELIDSHPQSVSSTPAYKPTPIQVPFQPSSTPEHLTSRFMKWNTVGIIRQYTSDEENSIDVEFHDAAVHHSMHFTNSSNFSMADLSAEAVVLASQGLDDQPSKVQCLHFGAWDNSKEWTIDMPDGEDIEAITLGNTWLAVATDTQLLRYFTLTGIQLDVVSIPGPVVCLAAFENFLLVVYHRAAGVTGHQCLGSLVLQVRGEDTSHLDVSLPLSPKTTLYWAGFSVQGTPFTCDSSGIIRMLNRNMSSMWSPVAETKKHMKGKGDNYWIVGISESPQQIRCIYCKGCRYPMTLPRPLLVVLPFQLPLCEIQSEKSQYEEAYHRSRLFSQYIDHWSSLGYDVDLTDKAESTKQAQEAVMKLFALSVRSEREYRAVDLCELMESEHTLQLAIKYASRLKHLQLAQRISELACERASREVSDAPFNNLEPIAQNEIEQEENSAPMECNGVQDTHVQGPMLKLSKKDNAAPSPTVSHSWSNPFKVNSQDQSHTVFKGSQIFDNLSKSSPKTTPDVSSQFAMTASKKIKISKKSNQSPLVLNTNLTNANSEEEHSKPITAYDLWCIDHAEVIRSETSHLTNDEFSKLMRERFHVLPREEKQVYLAKARETKSNDNHKRKRETSCLSPTLQGVVTNGSKRTALNNTTGGKDSPGKMVNAELSSTTNTKLSNFAFNK